MGALSHREITDALLPFGVSAGAELMHQIETYISLLLRWNEKIALTTIVDCVEIVKFHFGESLFAALTAPIREGRLADVGSGAGFPAMPLAMFNPDLHVSLIESSAKKAAFLSEVGRALALSNISVIRARMDQVRDAEFDFVTARALGRLEDLLVWASGALRPTGKLVLWLGDDAASRIPSAARGWAWGEPIRIPQSKRRSLLIGSPKQASTGHV